MPSKHKPVGVRFPPELLARVDQWAKANSTSRHGAALKLVEIALNRGATPQVSAKIGQLPPKAVLARAETKAAHLATPKPKKLKPRWSLAAAGVQVGPSPRRAMPKPTKGKK